MDLCVNSSKNHFSDTVFFVKQSEVQDRKKVESRSLESCRRICFRNAAKIATRCRSKFCRASIEQKCGRSNIVEMFRMSDLRHSTYLKCLDVSSLIIMLDFQASREQAKLISLRRFAQ